MSFRSKALILFTSILYVFCPPPLVCLRASLLQGECMQATGYVSVVDVMLATYLGSQLECCLTVTTPIQQNALFQRLFAIAENSL